MKVIIITSKVLYSYTHKEIQMFNVILLVSNIIRAKVLLNIIFILENL